MTERERTIYGPIGKRVRAARKAQGLTQGELAECVGITRTQINNLEQGRAATPLIRLLDIAEWLDTDPQALVFGEE